MGGALMTTHVEVPRPFISHPKAGTGHAGRGAWEGSAYAACLVFTA